MIEKTLRTTTGKLKVSIPAQLHEVSLGQMIQLQQTSELSDMQAISILSGATIADLQNVVDGSEFGQFADGILNLSHEISYLYNSDKIPEKVTFDINGKAVEVKVMKDLSIEPAGAYMAAKDIIADEISAHISANGEEDWKDTFCPSLLACAKVLAQYFFCKVMGIPYDEYAATDFIEVIKNMRVTEALPIAKHFFYSFPNLSTTKAGFWHRLLQLLKNVLVSTISSASGTSTR